MAYIIKEQEDFEKELKQYLEENPIENSYENSLVEDFSSTNLSDLYKLFCDLKEKELNIGQLDKLKNKLKEIYNFNIEEIFPEEDSTNVITDENINAVTNLIKDEFLREVSSNSKKYSEEELYKLTLIVNKIYPEVFLNLIETPQVDILESQSIIKERIIDTIEKWNEHNTPEAEEENRDIVGALYIATSKLYPEMGIYVPGRIKSAKSSTANINKEATRSLSSMIPNDIKAGLTKEDVQEKFNMSKATSDFSGFTIVLGNTDDTMHFDKSNPKIKELLLLRKNRDNNINFSHSLENFLLENEDEVFTAQQLYQMKVELLMRLRQLTYEECRKEYKGTSFTKMLENVIKEGRKEYEYGKDEYINKLDEIYELLDELKKRVHDKYQAKILEISVPEILEDELIKDGLHITWKFIKSVKKENGFCANYYELTTNDGRVIELQALTKMRFKDSKDGSSDHSNLPNKEVKIDHFFEPASENYDEAEFKKFLALLGSTPIAKKNTLYITPDQQLSPMDKRLKRRLKTAEQNVKLKEVFEEEHIFEDGSIQKTSYNLDTYLPIFAEYVSPKLMSASSHHTRFNKSVAGYNKKSIRSAFTEVLLKHDATSCLAQILIDRLEQLVPNDKNEISRNGIIKRANKRYGSAGSSEVGKGYEDIDDER